MSPASPLLLAGALLGFAGAVALGACRQEAHLDALSRELEQLRAAVHTARPRDCPVSALAQGATVPGQPSPPPEALAVRVVQLLEERERTRPPPEAPMPPALSAEAEATLTQAQRLADTVLAAGRMRPEEAAELRGLLARIGFSAQAHALRQRLIVATNRGALTLPPGTLPHLP